MSMPDAQESANPTNGQRRGAAVDIGAVVFDPTIYPRAEWSQATVNRYAEAIEAGDEFPPIVLERSGSRLLDGLHRLKAHSQALRTEIAASYVDVPEGMPLKLYAAGLSAKHGDRIGHDDLRLVAREVAEANPDFDLTTIAKTLGVTRQTVSKWVGDIVEHRRMIRRVRTFLLREIGWSTRQIADALRVSQKTVSNDVNDDIATHLTEDMLREAIDGEWVGYSMEWEKVLEKVREERIFASWSDEEREILTRLRGGMTVVVSLRDNRHANLIGWADSAGLYVRIDRRTEWGNPFEMPQDGDRDTVIENYRVHYLPYKPSLLAKLDALQGKALGCWCAPEPCHGDILAEEAER